MKQGKLKVGIAGYGVVGKRRREFIDQHPHLETVAVCDRTFSGDGVSQDGVRCFNNYHQLVGEDLDALFVCMTNDVAPEVTMAGLERGLHVFCEKPPGRDLNDVVRVIQCERQHPQCKLKYGFNHRYHDSVHDALGIVRSGELGKVMNMRGVYGKSKIIRFDSDWRTKRSMAGGGILLDQGIHMVDMMRLFAGEFKDVYSFVSNDHWKHDVEDNAYALMRTEDGIVAFLHSSATQWRHRFSLEITLSQGAIILSGLLSGSKSYGAETMTVVYATENDGGDPREQTTRYNQDHSWKNEIFEFADAILYDKPIIHGSSLEALKTMHLVYRIYCADSKWKERYQLSDTISEEFVCKILSKV
ncbi:MAG: Gfo/Idh/MocA family oxidoreductase [Chlamydiae bacterium]|nr:Gfo/Idh/MocA family oxidoreductase [Chlamydiota bacterium]MBI3276231.1 Gfo/Idh/MocA family oxidoreductase [Chlamydiota bacterium]